jgi:HK97 family phage major capsid protein
MGRTATGIILSSADYFSLFLNKADTSGVYSLPQGVTVGPDGGLRILGVPTYWIADQASGTYTIGAFTQGTALIQRSGPRIEMFIDATLAKNNQVLIRAEMREAFAIWGNTYIIKGTFA